MRETYIHTIKQKTGHFGMKKEPLTKKKKVFKAIKIFFLTFFSLFLLMVLAGVVFFFVVSSECKLDPGKLKNIEQTLIVYDAGGKEVADIYTRNRVIVPLEKVPLHVRNAVIAAEDLRFYSHGGVDVERIFGALWDDLTSGKIKEGASTISQQLIKNTHLTNEKTVLRKVKEAALAIQLEQQYTKDQILEMYLNYVYFGGGAYGIEAAAKRYFGKSVSELDIAEGATLAAALKSTVYYAPHLYPENSIKRRNLILGIMGDNGLITPEQAAIARAEPLNLAETRFSQNYKHGFFIDSALEEAKGILNISMDDLMAGGYKIHTTLDVSLQDICEKLFADPANFPPNAADGTPVQSAMVVIDAHTGEVRAVMGGREYSTKRGFNRATDMYRQPGSAIKPVMVYGPALESGLFSPATFIYDSPTDFDGYSPKNFGQKYYGYVTIRDAIAKSLNVPAVSVLNTVGIDSAKSFASRAGIHFEKNDGRLALALGGFSKGVTPLQLCSAYTAFANDGEYVSPHFITSIEDASGEVLYSSHVNATRIMSQENAFLLTSMLKSAVNGGTARRAYMEKIPLAGKTGTVDIEQSGNKDTWFVGYNPGYVAAVWVGFDAPDDKHSIPANATGGLYPTLLAKQFFEQTYIASLAPDFAMPQGIVEQQLDLQAMSMVHQPILASSLTPKKYVLNEYFSRGTEPTQSSDFWEALLPPRNISITRDPDGSAVISFYPMSVKACYKLMRSTDTKTSVVIGVYPGNAGEVVCTDTSLLPDRDYYYYVLPYMLGDSGERFDGQASGKVLCPAYTGVAPGPSPGFNVLPSPTPALTPPPAPSPVPVQTPSYDPGPTPAPTDTPFLPPTPPSPSPSESPEPTEDPDWYNSY